MTGSRIVVLIVLWLSFGSLALSAQNVRSAMTPQDLTGEWSLVSQESSLARDKRKIDQQMRISVRENELTIFIRTEDENGFTERSFVYLTDGRGETNRWTSETGIVIERKTKTSWKKGMLTTKGSYKINDGTMDTEDRCRLSNDLQKLDCEQTHRRPGTRSMPIALGFTTRLVYKRM